MKDDILDTQLKLFTFILEIGSSLFVSIFLKTWLIRVQATQLQKQPFSSPATGFRMQESDVHISHSSTTFIAR